MAVNKARDKHKFVLFHEIPNRRSYREELCLGLDSYEISMKRFKARSTMT